MYTIQDFEEELRALKKEYVHGHFTYANLNVPISRLINDHFGKQVGDIYGIYIIRQETTGEVLYIGKSGTLVNWGEFKGQDLPKRLKNTKGELSSNAWFRNLLEERGTLIVEYLIISKQPYSPTFVESLLLQAFLNDNGHLPYRNNAF
jgi:hypothetical protein